jgi:hypothetical protein
MSPQAGLEWATFSPDEERLRPLYSRLLGLRHVNPSGLLCFVFFEGAIGLGVLLGLAELVSWWAVLILPATVAVMVKVNDEVAAAVARSAAGVPEMEQDRFRREMGPAIGRAAVPAALLVRPAAFLRPAGPGGASQAIGPGRGAPPGIGPGRAAPYAISGRVSREAIEAIRPGPAGPRLDRSTMAGAPCESDPSGPGVGRPPPDLPPAGQDGLDAAGESTGERAGPSRQPPTEQGRPLPSNQDSWTSSDVGASWDFGTSSDFGARSEFGSTAEPSPETDSNPPAEPHLPAAPESSSGQPPPAGRPFNVYPAEHLGQRSGRRWPARLDQPDSPRQRARQSAKRRYE